MRTIIFLAAVLLMVSVGSAQDGFFSGPAIESGAYRAKYEEAQAQIEVQERLIAELRGIIHDLEAKLTCVCGEGCQCDAGGTPCPCPPRGKAKAAPYAKITMVWMSGCPTCETWWAKERPLYEAKGWVVERPDKAEALNKTYPYWRVCIGDSCEPIDWCPFAELHSKVQAIVDRHRK